MNKAPTGYLGDLSPEQQTILTAFRKHVDAAGPTKYDDAYLLRFCRARKFDLKQIIEMWDKFVKWRIDQDVDNITNFQFAELPSVREHYPHGYYKVDKIGRPLYIERIGKLKIDNLFQVTTEERMMRYYIQSYEFLINKIFPSCSAVAGKPIEQTCTILDLDGVGLSMATSRVKNFIKMASNIGQNYYPEILGKMYIINAPFLFSGLWAIVKPWLDEKTVAKIQIIGSGYKSELLKMIDEQNLPTFFGGKSTEELGMNPGPWQGWEAKSIGVPIPQPIGVPVIAPAGAPVHPDEETKTNVSVENPPQTEVALQTSPVKQ